MPLSDLCIYVLFLVWVKQNVILGKKLYWPMKSPFVMAISKAEWHVWRNGNVGRTDSYTRRGKHLASVQAGREGDDANISQRITGCDNRHRLTTGDPVHTHTRQFFTTRRKVRTGIPSYFFYSILLIEAPTTCDTRITTMD